MTSKIKSKSFKLFENVIFILINAILYFYMTRSAGPFQIYMATYFSFDQVRVLLGFTFVTALAMFYGPTRGIISILLGEFLVQWKLVTPPLWGFLLLYSLMLLPLYFKKIETDSLPYGKLALKVLILSVYCVFIGMVAFIFLAAVSGVPTEGIFLQMAAFGLSCLISYLPLVIILTVIFAPLRKPRTIYNSALTHHSWDDRDHTIIVRFGGLVVYLCTRCSGMVIGVICVLIFFDLFPLPIAPETAILLCILLPAPGLFIWSGQKFGFWKDKTWSRVLNGMLLGTSIFMLTKTHPLVLEMTLILAIYFVIFYVVLFAGNHYQQKKMEAEIEELLREPSSNDKEKKDGPNETRPNL